MQEPTIILACGARKRTDVVGAVAALDLYTGPLFSDARAWALSVAPRERIFILSARHGFVPAANPLSPYEQRLAEPERLAHLLRSQLGVLPCSLGLVQLVYPRGPVFFVGGADYRQALRLARFAVISLYDCLPFGREHRGLGAQRSWLRGHHGQLPLLCPA